MTKQDVNKKIRMNNNITTNTNTAYYKTDNTEYHSSTYINRKQYEEDLQRRQKEHLDNVYNRQNENWRPCLHDSCTECFGTGIKRDGSMCIHGISCPCPKCTPY